MSDVVITTDELMERARITRRTAYRWAKVAGFPGTIGKRKMSIGSTNLYSWPDVRAWLVATDRWDDLVDIPTGYQPAKNGGSQRKRQGQR